MPYGPAQIVVSDYPALDTPVEDAADDPNVKMWMSQIDWDGIPDFEPTGEGGCANTTYNSDFVDDAGEDGRCWWTCGGRFTGSRQFTSPWLTKLSLIRLRPKH